MNETSKLHIAKEATKKYFSIDRADVEIRSSDGISFLVVRCDLGAHHLPLLTEMCGVEILYAPV